MSTKIWADPTHLHLIAEPTTAQAEEQFLPGIDDQLTAMETLARIIDRDGSAVSATTTLASATSPATLLHEAAIRYADAVTTATRRLLGSAGDDALETAGPGPLPWLPTIPPDLREQPVWSAYLAARADRIRTLADQVREQGTLPRSLARYADVLTPSLRDQLVVWREANGVPDDDRSLLGPRGTDFTDDVAADRYARHLQREIDALYPASVRRWEATIAVAIGDPEHRDEHTLDLARELERLQADGINATHVLRRAANLRRPLPAEHRVEALAYRVQRIAANESAAQATPHRRSPPTRGLSL